MAAQDVEVIQLQGSCEPRACGPTQQTFPEEQETFAMDEPEVLSSAEKEEKRGILRRCSKYRSLFPSETEDLDLTPKTLNALNLEDLRDRVRDTEFNVSTRRSAAGARMMLIAALQTGEAIAPIVGLNLTGISSVASQNLEILTCCDEVFVKYDSMVALDPAVRLSIAICQLALAINDRNTREAATTPQDNVSSSANVISATPLN